MLVASKAAFLENYLAICTWISNGFRLNATRRSINDLVYLEDGRFKFMKGSKNELFYKV